MAQPNSKQTMEQRLQHVRNKENGIPEGGNLAKLLLNGLKTKDQATIEAVIYIEENLIVRAVQRLRSDIIQELIKELTGFIKQKSSSYRFGSLWLKHLIQKNSTILMSSPNVSELLNPITDIVQERIAFQDSLKGLQGKIKYFLYHLDNKTSDTTRFDEIIIPNDVDLSDSDGLDMYESPKEEEDDYSEEDEMSS